MLLTIDTDKKTILVNDDAISLRDLVDELISMFGDNWTTYTLLKTEVRKEQSTIKHQISHEDWNKIANPLD